MKQNLIVLFLTILLLLFGVSCQAQNTPQQIESPPTLVDTENEITQEVNVLPQLETPIPLPIELTETPVPSPTNISYVTPDWFKNAVLYLVYVRSFADSNGDGLGDLNGVTGKLDYLASLGVNTLWLMPIFPSPSEHGYDVQDFMAINPEYGTLADLQTLVSEAHERDIKVLLDFVPSHLSDQHPYFQDAYKNPASIYSDWFVWTNEAHSTYAGFANLAEMPRFNHYNPEVVAYLSEVALFWLDLDNDGDYLDGIDGFRIDNATFPPQEFFYALRDSLKQANPEALILGETWVNNPSDMNRFFENQFDALFDFPLYSILQGNQNFNGDGLLAGKNSPALLTILLEEQAARYPDEAISVRFANNHDTNRIATEVGGISNRMRLSPVLLASLPGVPLIYYGEEIGMFGQKGGPPAWDAYRREPMDWYSNEVGPEHATWFIPEDRWNKPLDGISVEEQDKDPDSLLNFYRKIFEHRQKLAVLRDGTIQKLVLQGSSPGPWGIVRKLDGEKLVALFNFSDTDQQIIIDQFPFSAENVIDLISGNIFPGSQEGEVYTMSLPATSAFWLTPGN
jgi:alpha-amylase